MDYFIGQIVWFAFDFEVDGFLRCNGQSLLVMRYQALFSLIETKYGGDGRTTFCIPTLKTESGSYQICYRGIYPPRS